ncbi:hypothetical protein J7T55_014855 [Diaporthe amygdali]|uniref:uncharacterized protein n=1 Tax=Phomopsis amygdali TaxID=1214568 RepID=UPI0022FE2C83|nr:uncharacterized protein J7T55_014855 [Diaporthe amygdali]KAJ0110052.1 hypothetical protein J7T55_014855 [Diaporthe amygdali]
MPKHDADFEGDWTFPLVLLSETTNQVWTVVRTTQTFELHTKPIDYAILTNLVVIGCYHQMVFRLVQAKQIPNRVEKSKDDRRTGSDSTGSTILELPSTGVRSKGEAFTGEMLRYLAGLIQGGLRLSHDVSGHIVGIREQQDLQ